MAQVTYDKSILNLLNGLSQVNSSIFIQREEDKIIVNSVDNSESIFYSFKADGKSFTFDGNECFLSNFPEFYRLVNIYENPTIEQNHVDLVIKQGRSKIEYRLTNPERADSEFDGVDFDDPSIQFKLNTQDIENIQRMIGTVASGSEGFVQVSIDGTELKLTLGSFTHENTYSETYSDIKNDDDEEVDFKLSTNIFNILPRGEYHVSVDPVGLFCFELIHEQAEVKLFTGILQNDE